MSKVQNAPKLLMPKATAVWLIDNTALTFTQIGHFTSLHEIEVQALADGEVGKGIVGRNPIEHKELTADEIARCEADGNGRLVMIKNDLPPVKSRAKGPRYTPVSKRGDKPDAIAWLIKHHPDLSDSQICKLVGTTKPTIQTVRDRTHANMSNIRPRHPAELGLCTYEEVQTANEKALKAAGKDPSQAKAVPEEPEHSSEDKAGSGDFSGFDFSNFLSTGTDESNS